MEAEERKEIKQKKEENEEPSKKVQKQLDDNETD